MVNPAGRPDAAEFAAPGEITGTAVPFVMPAPAVPPQIGFRGGTGSGKTHAAVQRITALLAKHPAARVGVFVPDHILAAEMAERLRRELGAGARVVIWHGMDRPDPGAARAAPVNMCRRSGDARAVRDAGGDLSDLCGSTKRGFCPFHPSVGGGCGYVSQGHSAAQAQVVVMTHAMLGRPAPPALQRYFTDASGSRERIPAVDFVFIDENFVSSMLPAARAVSVALVDPMTFPTTPDKPSDIAPGYADQQMRKMLTLVSDVIAAAAPHERIGRAKLEAAGLTAAECKRAAGYVLRCKADLPVNALPTAGIGAVAQMLATMAADNDRVLRVRDLLDTAAVVLDGQLGSAALKVYDRGGGREVDLRRRDPIHLDWLGARHGIIYADATMDEDIARVWLPGLVVPAAPPAAAPHMRVTQIWDRAFGYSAVAAGANRPGAGALAATNNARRVLRTIETLSKRCKGKARAGAYDVLVILLKALEDELSGKLPANVGTLHFGKLRGQDAFKDVAALLVVSRPLIPPRAAEDQAELISGRDVARLPPGEFYPTRQGIRVMDNGTGVPAQRISHHPDPAAEAVRGMSCEAELVQAIGRVRGALRTAANPVEVIVLNNVPIDDVPVSRVVTLDEIWRDLAGGDPVAEFERAGVLPLDWPGRGALLAGLGLYEGAADPGEAARAWFRRKPADGARLAGLEQSVAGGVPTAKPGRSSIYSSNRASSGFRGSAAVVALTPAPAPSPSAPAGLPQAWGLYRYRRAGSRRSGQVWVSPTHPDPRAAVEAMLGSLDMFLPSNAVVPASAVAAPNAHPTAKPGRSSMYNSNRASSGFRGSPPATVAASAPAPSTPTLAPVLSPAVPPAAVPVAQQDGDDPAACLDTISVGLPAVLDALEGRGCITRADRQRHMNRFRIERGLMADRERAVLARLSLEVAPGALRWAGRAAAARKLGVPIPAFDACPVPSQAAAA